MSQWVITTTDGYVVTLQLTIYHQQLIHSCGAMTGEMDLFAIHACQQIEQTWSARMGKMTLRVDDLEYEHPNIP